MRITKTDIKGYEISARRYLSEYGVEDGLVFDHFGLQSLSCDEYKDLKNFFIIKGKFMGETTYHNRRLGIFLLGEDGDKMELIEPHPGEIFLQLDCFVEHVAFRVEFIDAYIERFKDRIISTFNIEGSKGFVIQGPSQLLIEFRNNKL